MAEILIKCPYCISRGYTSDKSQHLSINIEKRVYHCWRCGVKGKWTGSLPKNAKIYTPKISLADLDLIDYRAIGCYTDYIAERLPNLPLTYKIYVSPQFPNRIFFPMFRDGYLIAVNGRSIDDSKPKYLTIGHKSEGIFNYENANSSYAVLCEGAFDALSVDNGIALFGKNISDTQIKLIISKYNKVFLAIHRDATKERQEIISKLSPYIEVSPMFWHKNCKDLNEALQCGKL